ncbi:hypothetical protein [Kitasatospora sp. NPDC101183]|uniref:hypothetical protein n=1 Tax=Kitasatospora sp. NPDC101183 TaxID=3364100 RepID=UPI0038055CFD
MTTPSRTCATHDACNGPLGAFADRYSLRVDLLGYLLLAVPGGIGVFWGAPLIARELEVGTHRLVWSQSVTCGRWLAAKPGMLGLLSVAVADLYSLLLTWASGPVATVLGNRFEPVLFAARGIALLGYATFAFVLGATLGLVVGRTVPAMAATLVVFAALQTAVPALIRPHYEAPLRTSVAFTAELIGHLTKIGTYGDIGAACASPASPGPSIPARSSTLRARRSATPPGSRTARTTARSPNCPPAWPRATSTSRSRSNPPTATRFSSTWRRPSSLAWRPSWPPWLSGESVGTVPDGTPRPRFLYMAKAWTVSDGPGLREARRIRDSNS